VAGNVSLDQATSNTLRVLDVIGASDLPVYAGMSRPLVRDHFDAAHFHGDDGLGGASFPPSQRKSEIMTAPEFIIRSAHAYEGELSLCFVGPLTNLAVALSLEPDLPELVDQVAVMGGAFQVPGNATATAEFNIAVDPEAAEQVARSALPVAWIGLDVTHSANLYREDWDLIDELATGGPKVVRDVCWQTFEERSRDRMHLHDPLAVGVLIDPSLIAGEDRPVTVDTSVRTTAGTTRMMLDDAPTGQIVAVEVESDRFRQMFGSVLGIALSDRT
jgi:purine nucleosidase